MAFSRILLLAVTHSISSSHWHFQGYCYWQSHTAYLLHIGIFEDIVTGSNTQHIFFTLAFSRILLLAVTHSIYSSRLHFQGYCYWQSHTAYLLHIGIFKDIVTGSHTQHIFFTLAFSRILLLAGTHSISSSHWHFQGYCYWQSHTAYILHIGIFKDIVAGSHTQHIFFTLAFSRILLLAVTHSISSSHWHFQGYCYWQSHTAYLLHIGIFKDIVTGSNTQHIFFTRNPSPLTSAVDEFLFGLFLCFIFFCLGVF